MTFKELEEGEKFKMKGVVYVKDSNSSVFGNAKVDVTDLPIIIDPDEKIERVED